MDGRVSESFPRPEGIPHNHSIVKSVRIGRKVISVLSRHFACCKLSID